MTQILWSYFQDTTCSLKWSVQGDSVCSAGQHQLSAIAITVVDTSFLLALKPTILLPALCQLAFHLHFLSLQNRQPPLLSSSLFSTRLALCVCSNCLLHLFQQAFRLFPVSQQLFSLHPGSTQSLLSFSRCKKP